MRISKEITRLNYFHILKGRKFKMTNKEIAKIKEKVDKEVVISTYFEKCEKLVNSFNLAAFFTYFVF